MYNIEILKSIDDINEAQLDAEYAVLESMIEAYDKASMILESYEGEDLSSFDIFQESVIMESDVTSDSKKKYILKRMWEAIIRAFKWIGKKIKSLFSKKDEKLADKADAIDKKVDEIKSKVNVNNKTEFDKKVDESLADVEKAKDDLNATKETVTENINTRHNMLNAMMNKLKDDIQNNDSKYKYEKIEMQHIDINKLNEFIGCMGKACSIISKIDITNEGVDKLMKVGTKISSYDLQYFMTTSEISLNEIDALNSKCKKILFQISDDIVNISNIVTQINEKIMDTDSISIAISYTSTVHKIISQSTLIINCLLDMIDSKVVKQVINDTDKALDSISKDLDDLLNSL